MNDRNAGPADYAIRPAWPGDFAALQQIELEAGRAFRDIGMHQVATDDPFSIDELHAYHAAGHAWVAADGDDRPIAYLVVDIVDGNVHIEQVSVRPAFGRRGSGSRSSTTSPGGRRRSGCRP